MREHELSVDEVVLTMPGQLQKTSSGKIMRTTAKKRYLESGFEVWATDIHRRLRQSCHGSR